MKSRAQIEIVKEQSASLFKHIADLEFKYFVTFFKEPNLFHKYYVKESIFSEEIVGKMMKHIETMFQDKVAVTETELFTRLQKEGTDLEYVTLKSLIKLYEQIPHNTIISTIQSIKMNTARKKVFEIVQYAAHQSKSNDIDIGEFISGIIDKLDAIAGVTSSSGTDMDDILDQIIMQTESIFQGEITTYYKTGVKEIDKKLPIVNDNIILVGGPAKAGKSRFVMWLVKKLMETNPGIFAVKWYSFEENGDEVARKFIAYDTMMADEELTGRSRKITAEETEKIVKSARSFKKMNVKIEDMPKSIEQVASEFQIFCKKNSDKIPILIIDNALLLTNDEFNRDDIIMNKLNHIKQRTKAIIFIVHHFNDEQQKDDRSKDAFRPSLKDLKGREAYRRVPKVVLLINYPYKYPIIKNKYKSQEAVLKNMFILDIAAIRYVGEKDIEGAGEEKNLIHFYCDLGVNRFYPLSDLHVNNKEYRQLQNK